VTTVANTKSDVLAAAKAGLIASGYSQLSTRRIAETAGVPLSQIHYHFGSKQNLILEVLAEENRQLLRRQAGMYGAEAPLWQQWEQACDFLDDDLDSGYVRVLQEMIAAGWSDPEIAAAVRSYLDGWFALLRDVATGAAARLGLAGALEPDHIAALVGAAFLGVEAAILLGFRDEQVRGALRAIGAVLRHLEEGDRDASANPRP
jgi:AcrR family transcriptional regulator